MLYNLSKKIDLTKFVQKVKKLIDEKAIVDLTKKTKRTPKQNRYLHLLLGWFALETGYTTYEAKILFKKLNKDIFEYEKKGFLFVRSSSDLDSGEMTTCIDRFRSWSMEKAEVYLPLPDEKEFLSEVEVAMSQNRYVNGGL